MLSGLKIIKTIQSNERFNVYEAVFEGRHVFAKQAKTDKTLELLAGLPRNSAIVNDLGKKSDFSFRAPEIYSQKDEWMISEWVEGGSINPKVKTQPQEVSDILAEFLVVFDKEPVENSGFRQIFTKNGLAQRMAERIPKTLSARQSKVLTTSKQLFDKLQPQLVPALQDADIKPDHIFSDSKKTGAYILVDSEHLGPQWPRFYDLGNNFAKFWVRQQKDFSGLLLKTFLNRSGLAGDEVFAHLLATLLVRGISLHWETDYDPGAESYNIPRAQDMLQACLAANNLDDLLY